MEEFGTGLPAHPFGEHRPVTILPELRRISPFHFGKHREFSLCNVFS